MKKCSKLILFILFVSWFLFACNKQTIRGESDNQLSKKTEERSKTLYQIDYMRRYGYLDYEGNLAIPMIYGYASRFVDGVAKVSLPDSDEFFYINCNNEKVEVDKKNYKFTSSYKELEREYDKLKEVNIFDEPIPPEGFYVSDYLGYGYFEISQKGKTNSIDEMFSGIIDRNGTVIIPPQEGLWFTPFIDGMSRITIGPRGFDGYLRKDGKVFWTKDYVK
ncbi:MAG: WG repeat-containing protein [Spirochaetales bacterium]|nr:WG repeat-containing protein [Spirochaetales bacterium]